MKKRILSILLALCMCLTFVPVTVLADDLPQQESGISVFRISPDTGTYYTYEFYVNGEKVDTQIVKNGDTLLEPQVEAQDGKVFTGWNPEVPFGTVSGLTGENKTIKVKAQFADGYHVYFKDNNGRIIATKTGKPGDEITFEDVNFAVGTDEAITGWYTDSTLTNKVTSVTIENSNITLYAKVEKGYWITFESNGGSYVAPAFYANGTTAEAPDEPTKSGYTFAGWYTDEGLTMAANFGSITESDTLYAKWTEDTNTSYTVIHWLENADDDGYSYMESETETGTTGGKTNAKAKSYTGFTAQIITQETIKGDGSTIVSVYYKRNVYSVKFYSYSGWLSPSEEYTSLCITAKYGANISAKWPTYNGSNAWATSDGGNTYQVNIDTMPLGGAKFYGPKTGNGSETAYYYVEVLPGETGTPGPGNLNYKLHHSDTSPGTGYRVTDEDKYPITGFTFKTFSAKRTLDGYKYNNAKFYYTRNSYNIVFVSNGSDEHTVSKKFEQSIADVNYTPKALTGEKSDYVFDGWYANKECTGDAFVFAGKTMPANNITLYAKWVAPTFTVTVYDQNGIFRGKTTVSKGDTVTDWLSTQKDEITLDTGDSFLGWTINRVRPFNPGTRITMDYNLYAKVGSTAQYTVTYDGNGGTGTVTDSEEYGKGAFATVKANAFTNGSKVFLGWNTKADGKGTMYYPNGKVEITGYVTLYAIWGDKASTVTVTYHSNFEPYEKKITEAMPNNKLITVAGYSALDLPNHDGYSFTGWNTKDDGSGTTFAAGASARVDIDGSNDLYAQWTPNQYSYTVNYYWNKTTQNVAPSKTVNGQTFNAPVTEMPINVPGYTPVSNDSQTIGTDTKEINFYYYKNVELTANSETYTYDGTEKSVNGFTSAPAGVDFSAITVGATGTNAGTYPATFAAGTVGTVDTTQKYIVTKATDGKLEITKRDVTITGESASKTYNGKVQEITKFTVEGLVGGHSLTGLTYSAKGMDAGKYDGSFTGQPVITDANRTDVTANYNVKTVVGVLTITRSYRPSTPSTPTTPVTSVKTGDMGIALYAMTSLLSLSGAVAIIKKRKEDEK